jgi:hypothetical protein
LIGDDEQPEPGLPQAPQRRRRAGKNGDLLRAVEIFFFLDHGSVPVQEDGARLIQEDNDSNAGREM